ncbi:MAG: sodium:solute symporter family protein [Bdellovibrionales bacterium]|nr:sodium:solute symporter family protein [Bdellovibrionales bacterium]
MNWELFWIGLYVLTMLIKGIWVSRSIKTQDDYFLGGRTLGPYLATFSIFATWFGAETCIGTAGSVYSEGLSAIHADPLGYTLCLLIMAFFFAKILWRKNITTIPDLFRKRFSGNTEKLAAVLMIPGSIIWAAAQIRALGQIVHANTSVGVDIAVTGAAIVVIGYTMLGGLLADAYNDLIQGIAVIIGIFIVFFAVVSDMGGIGPAMAVIPMDKLSFSGGEGASLGFLGNLELWMVPILGSLMAQELVSRVVASRSEKVAFNSTLRAASLYLMIGCIPVLIGLIGPHYLPNLQDPETLMPMLARTHMSYFFYIIFMGALVSAILSTVDTTLLSASALASHNLVYPTFKNLTEKQQVLVARLGTLASGILAYSIAYSSQSITGLVETASSLGGPSILIITIIALWVKKGNSKNAIFAMVMSMVTWAFTNFVIEIEYPIILTVLMCAVCYFISLPFTKTEESPVAITEPSL